MAGSAELVVKRRVRVSEQGRELHASWRVPVPKRQRERRIVYEFGQDSFVEVYVVTMEGEEKPALMDLELEVGEADLVVRAVAIGTVEIGLLGEATRIVVREGFHELDGF
ncbi:hypothetical protein TB2_004900 [Malus domestica]